MSNSSKLKKKYIIKVPKHIKVLYCDKKNILTVLGPSQIKSIKLEVKIFLVKKSNILIVTDLPVLEVSNRSLKDIKKLQGTFAAKIRHILIEVTYTLYHKLNLVGVGYRVLPYDKFENQLYFKLGYSHLIYFKIPVTLKTHCQKFTRLFIFGNSSFEHLTQIAAQIRACKLPEPYKGKGILYAQEKISLKKGKKI